MKKISFVLVAFAIVALFASSASAGLLISITGPNGTKEVAPGSFIAEVWANVTGADGTTTADEKLKTVTGGIQLTGSGTFTPFDPLVNDVAPFTFGAGKLPVDSSADGKLLGHGGLTLISNTGVLYFRTETLGGEVGLGPNWVPGKGFKLATFTVNNAMSGDRIDFLKSGATYASVSMYMFVIDGVNKDGRSTSGAPLISTGSLYVIPEPATLVLLGMGALALVFVRRRK